MVIEIFSGFVVAPFLVRKLGVSGYGLWIVIGSLSGYFSLIDLGLRGSVARQLSLHRANEQWDHFNQTFNSALAILCGLGGITLLATGAGVFVFDRLFEVHPDQIRDAKLALALVGVNLALSFPLQIFDGSLWAAQRFDLLNAVDIPLTLLRVAATFAFVRTPEDIVVLAVITLTSTFLAGSLKALLSVRRDRFLRFRIKDITRESGESLFGYGLWTFVLNVARLAKTQLSPVMIGSILGIAMVTPFSIARRLQDYAHKVIWTATGVLVPVATGFHARSQEEQQQRLFIEGSEIFNVDGGLLRRLLSLPWSIVDRTMDGGAVRSR